MDPVVVGEVLAVLLFAVSVGTLMLGYPVAFTLAGTAVGFAGLGWLAGSFDPSYFATLAPRYFGIMQSEVLVAVPLFILMGTILERTRIAEALLTTMGQSFGTMRGGLAVSVIVVGALLAASTGVVGATVVTMGLISLPAMLRAGYDPRLATGTICAAGTLGQIIPPSTILIFVADFLQGANAEAQARKRNFAPDPVSVSDLFAAAVLPGLILVALYILWALAKARLDPEAAPPIRMTAEERASLRARVLSSLIPPLALILAVLGSILAGIATPTESASVGAAGATALALLRRELSFARLVDAAESTLKTTSMVFVILFGASLFSLVFRTLGGELLIEEVLHGLPGGALRCGARNHGDDVRARLLPRHLRDHLHRRAADGAGPAHARDRPDLARGDDRGEPADLVPHPALRLRPVLPAWSRSRVGADSGDLARRDPVRRAAGGGARHALGLPRPRHLAAAASVRLTDRLCTKGETRP
jgi:tripartite ATP-independent transporter DctM subunit